MQNKKLLIVFVIILFIPVISLAYFWSEIGPTDIVTYDYYVFGGGIAYEIICEENGILVNEGGEWIEYSYYGLPVWDVETVMAATADIIVIMGDGTDSDGIYGFNFINHEFNVLHWLQYPHFINYCPADSHYYASGAGGLFKSEGGLNWQSVPYFNGIYCYDMVVDGDYYVVATSNDVYYSDDAGVSWSASASYLPLCDLEVSGSGDIWGVFPGTSYSSGLWRSSDHGATWTVEFWDMYMTCVSWDGSGVLFTGWNIPNGNPQGFAKWYTDFWELEYMNEGLGCQQINNITWNPLINCLNRIACTDEGLYMITGYETDISPDQITPSNIIAHNFPNPFNPETRISFALPYSTDISLEIYNAKGEKVNSLFRGFLASGENSLLWNGRNDHGDQLPSGIYHYKITAGQLEEYGKMILLK
ncbi:MAG: FlgD immunoglobulin-like domain containing protein [Candidatus Stygibacter frigidus]|nr:FlgD immunoglobulin-like domain containing protein [Candidatus Stygibacter frigidus]